MRDMALSAAESGIMERIRGGEQESSWRRNHALFDSCRTTMRLRRGHLLAYVIVITNGFPVQLQGKQHNAVIVTQTIPLARIVL